MAVGISAIPDIDLLYHGLAGDQPHHHAYPTHWASAWVAVSFVLAIALRSRRGLALAASIGALAVLHLVLDSIVGPIRWLAPWSDVETSWVTVPYRYSRRTFDLVLHWTFLLELVVTATAGLTLFWRLRHGKPAV